MAGRVARRVTGVVAGSEGRRDLSRLGNEPLAATSVTVEVEETLDAIDRSLRAALDRTDDSFGKILHAFDTAPQGADRS